jgi:hypothetical protein
LKFALEDTNSLFNVIVDYMYFQKKLTSFPGRFSSFIMLTKHERLHFIIQIIEKFKDKITIKF